MYAKLKSFIYLFINKENHRPISKFEQFICILIILDAISIGIMMTQKVNWLVYFSYACIAIYIFELLIRYIACNSARKFFFDPIHIFDILIITSCIIPDSFISNSSVLLCFRIFRIFRIYRLITHNRKMSTIIKILLKSVVSLSPIMLLMLVFLYVFGLTGMTIFRMPTTDYKSDRQQVYIEFVRKSDDYFAVDGTDPFGTISESMFTLLRVVTEQSWSNYRNNLIIASKMKIIDVPAWVVSFYFISWFFFGACLLLNLVIGAILQNYSDLYSKLDDQMREKQIQEKVEELINELIKDVDDGNLTLEEKQRLIQKALNITKR